ncbi:uncharacterized protein VTP21DRAFT_1610 [Calcarisporiella thermophila]|uniref:uncharacterized protein n=1 Tax=Calcarisporiella thermophila TaxID=911321 RepID=UPI003743E90D
MGRRILYVIGFPQDFSARELARKFEKFGPLVRCDIPAASSGAKPFAFVEFRESRDAEDAKYELDGRRVEGHVLDVQWARRPPSRRWKYERESRPRRRRSYSYSPPRRRSSRSPRRGSRSPREGSGRRERSPRRGSHSPGRRSPDRKDISPRDKSRSPRKRSVSPMDQDRSPRDKARSKSPTERKSPENRNAGEITSPPRSPTLENQ